jgi:hypothetical protein
LQLNREREVDGEGKFLGEASRQQQLENSLGPAQAAKCHENVKRLEKSRRRGWRSNRDFDGLRASWRDAREDLLNDLPTAVRLTFEDDYVAAFGSDFSAGCDGG